MARILFTLSFHLFIASFLRAQAPQGIPYQAVMRNADGTVMSSSSVNLTFMIHDGSATGTIVFEETYALTSNNQGLVSCVVGNGVVSQGNFSNINWGSGAKFLHVMMGTTDLGTQQMLSVPYALHSETTNVTVSSTGDTLTIGRDRMLVPGISAANPPRIYTKGNGVIDIEGNFYPTIIINGQEWTQKNLAVSKYRNGDPIPTGLDNAVWQNITVGAYAIYNNDVANNNIYGKLYNWYAVSDGRGLCPTGWHVPIDAEWSTLLNYLDPNSAGGFISNNIAGGKMKSTGSIQNGDGLWLTSDEQANNESGFTGLPGSFRNVDGSYIPLGNNGFWWSRTGLDSFHAWCWFLNEGPYATNNVFYKRLGFSVRCIKDDVLSILNGCTDGSACNFLVEATHDDGSCLYRNARCDDGNVHTTNDIINDNCQCEGMQIDNGLILQGNGVTDIDGTVYTSIFINGQEWMQQNLEVSKYSNGDPISSGLSSSNWQNTTIGAYTIYNNGTFDDFYFGKLYNWFAVNDSRGICPTGWHVPSDIEWTILETSLGGAVAGRKMKSTTGWNSPNIGATNESGFTGLPGGRRANEIFADYGTLGYWWSSTGYGPTNAKLSRLYYLSSDLLHFNYDKHYGLSVRCLRD